MESVWDKVKEGIKESLSAHSYRMWIEPIVFLKELDGGVCLQCPNNYAKSRVLKNYAQQIEKGFAQSKGSGVKVLLEARGGDKKSVIPKVDTKSVLKNIPAVKFKKNQPSSEKQMSLPGVDKKPWSGRHLRKGYTFDRFVVGGNNDFAYTAALSMASQKATNGNNALFLLSETGMGKSHLSQAVGHHILRHNPANRVYYVTAEDFTNEMVRSFQDKTIDSFKEKYRNQCDVLLMEDIQFLTGKDRTQMELAMILDYLFESDKKIIFSSCYQPSDIPKMNSQLKSRLTSGLMSRMEAPDYKTRLKILRTKTRENKMGMPGDVLEYLASELTDDVRQLESGLNGVIRKSSLMGMPINLELAENQIRHLVNTRKKISVEVIKKMVSKQYNLSVDELISSSRRKHIVKPRQLAIYLSRKYTDQPLQSIGRSFNRYHATALHSVNVVEKAMKANDPVRQQVGYLCEKLDTGKFC